MTTSQWRAERNRKALARLMKALPAVFPSAVLARALARPFIPPMPRLAVDGYWRAHPLRADALARALAARSGTPEGWTWRLSSGDDDGRPASFRAPPAPFREKAFSRGAGTCCVCGQPVFRFGWHADLWDAGPNLKARWHTACVIAWQFWNAPSDHIAILKKRQARRCTQSGERLRKTAEVDHREPLFRVWGEHRDAPWPTLLGFWGTPNLQVINRHVHVAKCTSEAGERRHRRAAVAAGGPGPPDAG
jgi:hypothetical protein